MDLHVEDGADINLVRARFLDGCKEQVKRIELNSFETS